MKHDGGSPRIWINQSECVPVVLNVVIIERSPNKWEWRVCDRRGTTIISGFERTRQAAKYAGDRALFGLLVSGWDER
jgi:hypothetical protein